MANEFSMDENYRDTGIRIGNPIGGYLRLPANTDRNVWHRLMPNGDATHVADTDTLYKEKLNIGALRSDIANAPILGWLFRILNDGYRGVYGIKEYKNNIVWLYSVDGKRVELQNIPPPVKFIIYPQGILPFNIYLDARAGPNNQNPEIEIGLQPRDIDSNENIHSMGEFERGKGMKIPFNRVDRLFFKVNTGGSGNLNNHNLTWGEQEIHI